LIDFLIEQCDLRLKFFSRYVVKRADVPLRQFRPIETHILMPLRLRYIERRNQRALSASLVRSPQLYGTTIFTCVKRSFKSTRVLSHRDADMAAVSSELELHLAVGKCPALHLIRSHGAHQLS
jgi:hypothetical protein